MTTSISVSTPATVTAPAETAPVVSVSADAAKLLADAVAEAKAELAKVEAALKGDESTVVSWFKANWAHVVTWVVAGAGGVSGLIEIVKHV